MAGLFIPLSPDAARLQTLLNRHGHDAVADVAGTSWRLRPSASGDFEGPACHGELGDSAVTVWLAEPEWRLVVADVLGVSPESAASCPEPFVRAALESATGEALTALEQATGLAATVKGVEVTPSRPVGRTVRFDMTNSDGLTVRFAALFAKPEGQWSEALARMLSALPARVRPLREDLPLPTEIRLGRVKVPVAGMKDLECGDVLLFPAGSGAAALCGGWRFPVEFGDGVIRVGGGGMAEAGADVEAEADVDGGAMDVDSLEVEVTAQVGRITLTLGQLRRLGAGQVVEFATAVEEPARLTVGGKTVARGELVDVGGRVGVRILTLDESGNGS